MEAFEKPAETLFQDKPLDQDAKPLHEGSKGAVFMVEKSWENRFRVSRNGKEGSCVDEDGEGLEDSEMNGVSSLLQMKGSVRNIDVNGGSESVVGFGTLLGAVDKSKEEVVGDVEKMYPSGDRDDGVSVMDNHRKNAEIDGKEKKDLDDKENDNGMIMEKVKEIDAEEGDDDGDDDLGCEFSTGDFVWGKIKSHPWWPGQIYDPLDASEYAVKIRQKRRLLVAYFGDGSFAWCRPSQLKRFEENFEDMSKMSNSKSFLNAVQASVDEIGRLLELKMTCSCVPKEKCTELDRPLAANAGIKEGVFVPESGIEKLSIGVFEPEEILRKVKQIAQAVSMINLLECTVLKCWLLAYNRLLGRHEIPMYHEPMLISDLGKNVRSLVADMSNYSDAVQVPITGPVEEHWVSSSSGTGFGQHGRILLRCPEILEDGMEQSRKLKSIAEIIKGGLFAEKGTKPGQQASSFRRKKMGGKYNANDDEGSNSSSQPRKRKGSELSGSFTTRRGRSRTFSAPTDVIGTVEEMDMGYLSSGRKKKSKGESTNNDDGRGKEHSSNPAVSAKRRMNIGRSTVKSDAEMDYIDNGSLLRERRRSKYLSPPYTIPTGKLTKVEAEYLKVANDTHLDEPMGKRARGERNQLPKEVHAEQEASNDSSFHTPKRYRNKIDLAKVKISASEVLIEVRSVALSPQYRSKNNSFENVVEFLSVFRSSVYREGSTYEICNQFQSQRKRKSPDHVPSGQRSQQKKVRKKEETEMAQPKPRQTTGASLKKRSEESKVLNPAVKHAARAAVTKKKNKVVENASTASFFVTFGPGSSLPTKDDLIRIYSKYGVLNTEETDMFYNNFFARVAFLRRSDAERAFNSSQNDSPFGVSNVTFRLSTASPHEQRIKPRLKSSPLAKVEAKTSKKTLALQNSAAQKSELNNIRNKLKTLTSMLEISDEKMSADIKSKVHSEIKGILKKVSSMVESSS